MEGVNQHPRQFTTNKVLPMRCVTAKRGEEVQMEVIKGPDEEENGQRWREKDIIKRGKWATRVYFEL